MFTHKDKNPTLPEFKVTVTTTHDVLTLQFMDNTTNFTIKDGYVNGWEIDDAMTKYIKRLMDTTELRNQLSGRTSK